MFAQRSRQNLVRIADAYAKASGVSRASVSKTFYGRGDFLDKFRHGKRSISIDKMDAVLRQFRKAWPPDAEWPTLPVVHMGRGS